MKADSLVDNEQEIVERDCTCIPINGSPSVNGSVGNLTQTIYYLQYENDLDQTESNTNLYP